MANIQLEVLPVPALPPVVVAGEEIDHPLLHQGDRHSHRQRVGGRGVGRRPLVGVVFQGVVVVAVLVGGEVVGLDHGMVSIRVENCENMNIISDRRNEESRMFETFEEEKVGQSERTEEIAQAEVLAGGPFLVIDARCLEVVIPTQGVTHCVILVSFCTSRERENKKKKKKQPEPGRARSHQHSLFHPQILWKFVRSRRSEKIEALWLEQ